MLAEPPEPWRGFLAVAFPQGAPPSTAGVMAREFGIPLAPGVGPNTVLSVYPTQLFEVAMGLAMFGIVWRLRDHRHAEGWLFGVYAVLAGIERFIVEFYRAKDDRLFHGLTYAQLIAIGFVVFGVVWMAVFWRVRAGWPGIYGASPSPSPGSASAPRSSASSARARRSPPARSRSPRAPRRCSSSRCARH